MGSFGAGFLSSVSSAVKQKSDQAAAEAQQKKHDEAAVHMAALQSGTLTPDQQQAAWDNWQKLYGHSKGLKEVLPKIKEIASRAMNHNPQGQSGAVPPPPGGQQPQSAQQPAQQPTAQDYSASLSQGGVIPGVPPPPGSQPKMDTQNASPVQPPIDTQNASPAAQSIQPAMSSAIPPPPGAQSPTPVPSTGGGKSASDGQDSAAVSPDVPAPPPSARTMAVDSSDPTKIFKSTQPQDTPATPPTPPAASAAPPAAPVTVNGKATGVQPWELAAAFGPTVKPMGDPYLSQDGTYHQRYTDARGNVIDKPATNYNPETPEAAAQRRAAALSKSLGRPLTADEMDQVYGLKPETGANTLKFDNQTVQGNRLPINAVDSTGNPISVRDPKQSWQAIGMRNGNPVYLPTDPSQRIFTQGNLPENYNPKSGLLSDPINNNPVNLGTSGSSMAPLTAVVNGQVVQLPGSHSSAPRTAGGGTSTPPATIGSPTTPPQYVVGNPSKIPGMVTPGNIDIMHRPNVQNPDGTHSSVRSISIGTDQGEVLIPTVSDGSDGTPPHVMTNDEAVAEYKRTGKNLGVFDTPANATKYAEGLHEQQAKLGPTRSPRSSSAAAQKAPSASAGASLAGLPPGARVLPRGVVGQGMETQQGKMYSAVMDPYTQIFGDPDNPDIPPLSHYAALANNKEASSRIATAVNLSMQGLQEEGEKGGGILKVFTDEGGLPSLQASAHADAINSAIQAMTPLEREAYDKEMQGIGTIVGMRSITGGSGGRWSVNNIKNEFPLLGINVADEKEFNRRLASFAQQMYTASAKAPIFSDADRQKFLNDSKRLAKSGYTGSVPPPPPSKAAAPAQHKVGDTVILDGKKVKIKTINDKDGTFTY